MSWVAIAAGALLMSSGIDQTSTGPQDAQKLPAALSLLAGDRPAGETKDVNAMGSTVATMVTRWRATPFPGLCEKSELNVIMRPTAGVDVSLASGIESVDISTFYRPLGRGELAQPSNSNDQNLRCSELREDAGILGSGELLPDGVWAALRAADLTHAQLVGHSKGVQNSCHRREVCSNLKYLQKYVISDRVTQVRAYRCVPSVVGRPLEFCIQATARGEFHPYSGMDAREVGVSISSEGAFDYINFSAVVSLQSIEGRSSVQLLCSVIHAKRDAFIKNLGKPC